MGGLHISRVTRHDAILGLYVKSIKEDGLVHAWNVAHPNSMVCIGDRVLSVNGHAATGNLHAELKKYKVLRMEFIREIDQPFKSIPEDHQAKRSESQATKVENSQE